jgi:hypothetical protein
MIVGAPRGAQTTRPTARTMLWVVALAAAGGPSVTACAEPHVVFTAPRAPFGVGNGPRPQIGFRPQAMVIEQGIDGSKLTPRSLAWVTYDDTALIVAIDNAVSAANPLRRGDVWGQDDAVEIALRNPAAGKDAATIVLRGFTSGHFDSSGEAGAPEAIMKRAAQGVQYRALIVDAGRWTASWRIPFASLRLDPAKDTRLLFNISVRKTAGPDWVMWQGTHGNTWDVENAGVLELGK